MLADHRERRRVHGRAGRDSIEEFLFTYYHYRPAQLRRWHPGPGILLADAERDEFGSSYVVDGDGAVRLDAAGIVSRRRESVEWILRLLTATADREPSFGCFGIHEWAMVYRQDEQETRHHMLPLRLGVTGTAAVVDGAAVRCTHFDAYRFFTPAARPLNLVRPTRETQHDHEQPGCLHANMDIYRWAYKVSPLVPSEFVVDCFELARDIRVLDIRSSPYDLTTVGLRSIPVETAEGRADYARAQRAFASRAAGLRRALIGHCEAALRIDSART